MDLLTIFSFLGFILVLILGLAYKQPRRPEALRCDADAVAFHSTVTPMTQASNASRARPLVTPPEDEDDFYLPMAPLLVSAIRQRLRMPAARACEEPSSPAPAVGIPTTATHSPPTPRMAQGAGSTRRSTRKTSPSAQSSPASSAAPKPSCSRSQAPCLTPRTKSSAASPWDSSTTPTATTPTTPAAATATAARRRVPTASAATMPCRRRPAVYEGSSPPPVPRFYSPQAVPPPLPLPPLRTQLRLRLQSRSPAAATTGRGGGVAEESQHHAASAIAAPALTAAKLASTIDNSGSPCVSSVHAGSSCSGGSSSGDSSCSGGGVGTHADTAAIPAPAEALSPSQAELGEALYPEAAAAAAVAVAHAAEPRGPALSTEEAAVCPSAMAGSEPTALSCDAAVAAATAGAVAVVDTREGCGDAAAAASAAASASMDPGEGPCCAGAASAVAVSEVGCGSEPHDSDTSAPLGHGPPSRAPSPWGSFLSSGVGSCLEAGEGGGDGGSSCGGSGSGSDGGSSSSSNAGSRGDSSGGEGTCGEAACIGSIGGSSGETCEVPVSPSLPPCTPAPSSCAAKLGGVRTPGDLDVLRRRVGFTSASASKGCGDSDCPSRDCPEARDTTTRTRRSGVFSHSKASTSSNTHTSTSKVPGSCGSRSAQKGLYGGAGAGGGGGSFLAFARATQQSALTSPSPSLRSFSSPFSIGPSPTSLSFSFPASSPSPVKKRLGRPNMPSISGL